MACNPACRSSAISGRVDEDRAARHCDSLETSFAFTPESSASAVRTITAFRCPMPSKLAPAVSECSLPHLFLMRETYLAMVSRAKLQSKLVMTAFEVARVERQGKVILFRMSHHFVDHLDTRGVFGTL